MREPAAPPSRPGTVTAAGGILLVGAGLGLLAAGGVILLAGEARLPGNDQRSLAVVSGILATLSLLSAVVGYFILRGAQWARVTAIVVSVLGVVTSLVSLFTGFDPLAEVGGVLGTCSVVILSVLVIFLLSGSRASDYFRYGRRRR